jgi:hypothetical protein
LKVSSPLPVREMPLCCKSGGNDQQAASRNLAIFGCGSPFPGRKTIVRSRHVCVKLYIFLDVQYFVHMVEIRAQFGPRRVGLRPSPILPNFWYRVFVYRNLRVHSGARVAVLVLDPAKICPGFESYPALRRWWRR